MPNLVSSILPPLRLRVGIAAALGAFVVGCNDPPDPVVPLTRPPLVDAAVPASPMEPPFIEPPPPASPPASPPPEIDEDTRCPDVDVTDDETNAMSTRDAERGCGSSRGEAH